MAEDDQPPAPRGGDALGDLADRIARARATSEIGGANAPRASAPPSGLGAALRISTELFAGVIVGGGLGYFLDRALGSSPICLVLFVLIGFAAGTVNLVRAAAGPKPPPDGPAGGPETGRGA
jgi:ATP synthase protein I